MHQENNQRYSLNNRNSLETDYLELLIYSLNKREMVRLWMQDISFTGTMFGYETKWKVVLFLPFLFVFRKTTAHLIEPDWRTFG